jgi:predicted ester cyclase
MSLEDNKAISRRYFEEVFSQGKLDVADEIYTPNHINAGPAVFPGLPSGPAGIKMLVTVYRDAFPDVKFTIDEQIAEGDKVVTRWTATGTPKDNASDVPMPDTAKTSTGVTINRFVDRMIAESWAIFDQFGLMQQLGIIPTTD